MDPSLFGLIGELKAFKHISGEGKDMCMRYLSNFPLKYDSTYGQADAIVVCTKGVFCLEVKSWMGVIDCTSRHYWTVDYADRRIVTKSPILQNRQHCRVVSDLLQCEVNNIVLVVGNLPIGNAPPSVMHVSEFIPLLKRLPPTLAESEINEYMLMLDKYKKSIEPGMLADFIFKRLER